MFLVYSMSTAVVLGSWLEAVLPMRHRRQHLTENYAERKRSVKDETFNRFIKVGFLIQWRKPAFNQKQFV